MDRWWNLSSKEQKGWFLDYVHRRSLLEKFKKEGKKKLVFAPPLKPAGDSNLRLLVLLTDHYLIYFKRIEETRWFESKFFFEKKNKIQNYNLKKSTLAP
jgi:hypothetical protein